MTTWELQRNWDIVRYLVYYLVEDFVPAALIPGRDVIDFSAGLGDLSLYLHQQGPRSIVATSPDNVSPPAELEGLPGLTFLPNLPAREIDSRLQPASADVFLARMVFQFPTDLVDRIDVDGMLAQIYRVLRPGGRLIISSHEFTQLDDRPELWNLPVESHFRALSGSQPGPQPQRLAGLVELIQALGLPPREGIHGQTGFGLKGLMAVDSFLRAGFIIEETAEIEDFTFPIGIGGELAARRDYYRDLAARVFEIKRQRINSPEFQDKYLRPGVLQQILREMLELHPFATIPIFRIQACKPA